MKKEGWKKKEGGSEMRMKNMKKKERKQENEKSREETRRDT